MSDEGDKRMLAKRLSEGPKRNSTIRPAVGLCARLVVHWESDTRELDVQIVTVNGSIAGAFPCTVANGQAVSIHPRFIPRYGSARIYVRLAAAGELHGLSVSLELRDKNDRQVSAPLLHMLNGSGGRSVTIERDVEIPETLAL